jgi:hypothetical protein
MTFKSLIMAALACFVLSARAGELGEKGRAVFKQHQHEVVTVQLVQKMMTGRGEAREGRQDITGTVIDPSGLTVLALSAADPSEMYKRMYSGSSDYKLEIEVSDVKILLDDGTEIPAEIVLRDKDLDLAFIRPKTKPAKPMAAVDLNKAATAQMLDELITLNRLGRAAGRAHAASIEHVSAVVQKPRTFYIPDSRMTGTALGSPAFALDGRIVGIVVMRIISSSGGASNFRPDSATSIILPAEDIAKAAKQAPEAKGEDEKKEEKKEEPKEQN